MNPTASGPGLADYFDPKTAVHVAIGVVLGLILYHFMFNR